MPLGLKKIAAKDSANYVAENFNSVGVFLYRHDTVRVAAKAAKKKGYFLEFGVHTGGTITQAAKLRSDQQFYGFDSFEGLPEDWDGTSKSKGDFDLGGVLPDVPNNVTLVKGWFDQTIPKWKNKNKISYLHVDCDLYSSTVTIFKELEERFEKGTIILFDEYFGYHGWRQGEHKAFLEMLVRTGFSYDALAVSHMALVVRLS